MSYASSEQGQISKNGLYVASTRLYERRDLVGNAAGGLDVRLKSEVGVTCQGLLHPLPASSLKRNLYTFSSI